VRRGRAGGSIVARFVALAPGEVLAPGEIAWDAQGRITALRRARRAARVADVAVLPGLVNAHVHLQLPALVHAEQDFVAWLGAVLQSRAGRSASVERRLVRDGVRALRAEGVAAVGEIDSTGQSLGELLRLGVAGRCYREVTGFHLDAAAARRIVRAGAGRGGGGLRTAFSPHAPYSVSPALFRAAAVRGRHFAVHCAEVPEEQEFLRTGRGPFAELLRRLGRLPEGFRAPGVGAVPWLERLGVLGARTQLVHCQHLERGDAARIRRAGAAIVVCPGTIDYFRREPPPVPRWLADGIPVALGTDSRASNTGLSLRTEMQRAQRLWPSLRPEQIWSMATTMGAKALSMPGIGRLRRGASADFAVVPALGDWGAVLGDYVAGALAVRAVAGGMPVVS
jgi:aminodeoxyfutalosine deaminase